MENAQTLGEQAGGFSFDNCVRYHDAELATLSNSHAHLTNWKICSAPEMDYYSRPASLHQSQHPRAQQL
jgi:hypothetical protein